jgi:hypothetical protein
VDIQSHEMTIRQLTKHYNVLCHTTSDLATFSRITKILMIPNISAPKLQSVLAGDVSLAAVSSNSDRSYRHMKCNMRETSQCSVRLSFLQQSLCKKLVNDSRNMLS